MYVAPWALRELVLPVRNAIRTFYAAMAARAAQPRADAPPIAAHDAPGSARTGYRVIQIAGAIENSDWLVQICRRLRTRGHDVSAVIGWPERSLAHELQENGVPYGATMLSFAQDKGRLRLPIYMLRLPGIIVRLAWQFRRIRTTVVHTHIFNSIIIGRLAAWLALCPAAYPWCRGRCTSKPRSPGRSIV